jgi:hypothetical protein
MGLQVFVESIQYNAFKLDRISLYNINCHPKEENRKVKKNLELINVSYSLGLILFLFQKVFVERTHLKIDYEFSLQSFIF